MSFFGILGTAVIVALTLFYAWMGYLFIKLSMGYSSEAIIAKIREIDLDIPLRPVFAVLGVFMAISVFGTLSFLVIYLQMV